MKDQLVEINNTVTHLAVHSKKRSGNGLKKFVSLWVLGGHFMWLIIDKLESTYFQKRND